MSHVYAASPHEALEDWNFIRISDDVAVEIAEGVKLGSPSHINPMMHLEAWQLHKAARP